MQIDDGKEDKDVNICEKEMSTGKSSPPNEYDELMINDIYSLLISFVSSNGEAWAPIISTWSLELLGEISTHYAGRACVNGLNESLQLWMNCRATKTLIDITTQCLACLMHTNTEACISALLDTSVKHSPHFDWVVAHVGSCFPQTVIERVLFCGLKDYCENKSYRQGIESPKLKSVVGIVGHLATSHPGNIQNALLDLFKSCLNEDKQDSSPQNEIYRKATVPFLIQLFVLSDTMLNAISDQIKENLTVHTITKLYNMTNDWFKFFGSIDALQETMVALIMKCSKGGEHIIELLLKCIALNKKGKGRKYEDISNWTRELLECVLEEVDYKVRFHSSNHMMPAAFLNSLIYDIDYIYLLLLHDDALTAQTAARLIIYIGVVNPPLLIQALSFLLQNAKQPSHLAYFVRILNNELICKNQSPYAEKGGPFSIVLQHILDKDFVRMKGCTTDSEYEKFEQMWSNILLLLKWEKTNNIFMLKSKCISKGIEFNLTELTGIFRNKVLSAKCTDMLCEVLDLLDIPNANSSQMSVQVTLNYVHGAVNYFFQCCNETDLMKRISGFKQSRSILKKLCISSKVARNLALRQLLERALFSKDAVLFGAKPKQEEEPAESNKDLITENKKISKTIPLSKHSSVYNGGVIGHGKRKSISLYRLPVDLVAGNSEELITAIKESCVRPSDSDASLTLISLTLVQLVSPDVMYNGLPWLEEEFSKVTIERDLLIRRLFNSVPLLWDLLNLVAQHRPSLCYCSVLLRALTATLIHQWTSMGDQRKSTDTENYKDLMGTTIAVLDVMALGQLLPAPLCNVRDVITQLNSHEIVSILRECIWCYMRDNVPSPALFEKDPNGLSWRDPKRTRPDDVYTKTLRTIMQRNIKTVGHLYSRMFITANN
ncbi:integrator complex subunit 5 isoform X2 [Atheta coriaria]|uniref:integrator complex subunit 5 isoform X2 n=1 Tax=Dalotia coriaria TaxID=877792 RepID=UPI0031F43ECF